MPEWLYEEVKDEIPSHIGVTDGKWNLKKAKKVDLGLTVNELYINLVCALSREANKYYTNLDEDKLMKYRRTINRLEKAKDEYYQKYVNMSNKYHELKYKI